MKQILAYGLKNMQGGLEKYMLSMQRQLCSDYRFCYLVEQGECMHREEIEKLDGEVVWIPVPHPAKEYVRGLHRLLKEWHKKTDTLYVNINSLSRDIIVIVIGWLLGYRLIVHSHNAGMEPIKSWKHRIIHSVLGRTARYLLMLLPAERLAVSEKAGNFMYGFRRYSLVYPGILTEKFCFSPEKRDEIRKRYDVQGLVCGFVGRLVEIKNPFFLLDVFAQICQRQLDSRLLMVGDGPLKAEIQAYAKSLGVADAVIFTGEVPNVQDYIQAMDVQLCTSFSEGLSLVAVEGQASGLPCVVAENNYPRVIQVTELLHFMPLAAGSSAWAEQCIRMAQTYSADDRAKWNRKIKQSAFDIENVAKNLARFIQD